MKISKSKRLDRLAEHLACCHTAAEKGHHDVLADCLVTELGPVLSYVTEDFENLKEDFQALEAQIEQANADVEHWFALLDKPRTHAL